ncbi:MAG: hypothetical protein QM820_04315 [Minicystis sp.]
MLAISDHPTPAARLHAGHERLDHPHHREDILVVQLGPPLRPRLPPVVLGERARVVDEDVDVTKRPARLLGHAPRLLVGSEITERDGRVLIPDLGGDPTSPLLVASLDHHGGALGRQRLGDRLPDAARAPRHQRAFARHL